MADERRQFPRIPMRVAAEVRGMSIELPSEAKVGDTLRVRLRPPTGPTLELDATVRHCTAHESQFTVGVQFTNLDAPTKQAIEVSIRAHGGTLTSSLKPK